MTGPYFDGGASGLSSGCPAFMFRGSAFTVAQFCFNYLVQELSEELLGVSGGLSHTLKF